MIQRKRDTLRLLSFLSVMFPALLFAQSLLFVKKKPAKTSFLPEITRVVLKSVSEQQSQSSGGSTIPVTVKRLMFAGITAGLLFYGDSEIDEEYGLEKDYSPLGIPGVLGEIGDAYDRFGPGKISVGVLGLVLANGVISGEKTHFKTAEILVKSVFVTSLFTGAGKMLFGRDRPYKNTTPKNFSFFKLDFDSGSQSMPSGHTSHIFTVATVLAKRYNSPWIRYPAYTLAVSVACQRMNRRKHWASDVLLGGALGYFVGSYFVNKESKDKKRFQVQPALSPRQLGLQMHF